VVVGVVVALLVIALFCHYRYAIFGGSSRGGRGNLPAWMARKLRRDTDGDGDAGPVVPGPVLGPPVAALAPAAHGTEMTQLNVQEP
jgi:hypothetical protein